MKKQLKSQENVLGKNLITHITHNFGCVHHDFGHHCWHCMVHSSSNISESLPLSRVLHLVGGHGAANPGVVVADLGVDSRLVPLGAPVTPGHHTLQLIVAHHRATGVTLTGHR